MQNPHDVVMGDRDAREDHDDPRLRQIMEYARIFQEERHKKDENETQTPDLLGLCQSRHCPCILFNEKMPSFD